MGEGVAGASAGLGARLAARTSPPRSFEGLRRASFVERPSSFVEDDDALGSRRGLSGGRRPVLLEEPKAGIVRGRARSPLGRASPLTEERTKTRCRNSLHDTAVCFSFRFRVPPTTATRARSVDASTSKTSRVLEMAMSTRMTERNKENDHRVSNAEASPPVARSRRKPAVQKTKRKGLESAVAVPSSKRSTRATGRETSPRPNRRPQAVAVHAESPYRSLAEAFLRASSTSNGLRATHSGTVSG